VTLKEAAELAGVTPDTLRQAVHRGTLRATKRGRDWTVTRRELARYMALKEDDMTRQTQQGVILAWLQDRGSITQHECSRIGGGSRLAAHILELRKDGWNILTQTVAVDNVLGGVSRVGRYVWGPGPQQLPKKAPAMTQLRIDGEEELVG